MEDEKSQENLNAEKSSDKPTEKPKKSRAGLIVVIIVLIILIGGGIGGYLFVKSNFGSDLSVLKIGQKAVETAFYQDCIKEQSDKDLCKYMSNFKDVKNMSAKSTSTLNGSKTETTWETEGDNKSRVVSVVDGKENYQLIVIGDTSYSKDYTDNKWWKLTNPSEVKKLSENVKPDTQEKVEKVVDQVANTTTYKKLAKESCGKLNCFKYQIVDSTNPEVTEYIWFDDKDYLLRKSRTESKDIGVSETTYSYDNISIQTPSPTKEAGSIEDLYKNMTGADLSQTQEDLESSLNNYSAPVDDGSSVELPSE